MSPVKLREKEPPHFFIFIRPGFYIFSTIMSRNRIRFQVSGFRLDDLCNSDERFI